MDKVKFAKIRKTAIAALCAVSLTCTGLAAACAPETPEEPSSPKTQREDPELLKNGNFEYATVPEKAVHLIKSATNWTRSGDSSGVMSGIIDTSATAWEKMSDPGLRDKLNYNNDLNSSDPDYKELHVDYNGMGADDIPYLETYAAGFADDDKVTDDDDVIAVHGSYKNFMGITENGDGSFTYNGQTVYPGDSDDIKEFYYDTDFTRPVRYTTIANPLTHLGEYNEKEGKSYLGDTPVYVDENGNYFTDADLKTPVGNVLMIHNYPTNRRYNGISQHYTSQSVTLEANTAAEISVWVKTYGLKFDKGYSQLNDENRGAYIEITQSIGSTAIDSFKIRAINTEKIIADKTLSLSGEVCSNGWLKYTVYVNACDFASSTITINLGLGDEETGEKVTGYAFFDDVTVNKFIDLGDSGCTYNANKANIDAEPAASCTLVSEGDEKIFTADRQVRGGDSARYSNRFFYLLDLASENVDKSKIKTFVPFTGSELKISAELTTEESGGKFYSSSLANDAKVTDGINKTDKPETYVLPDSMKKTGGRLTFNDLIGVYGKDKTSFTRDDFANTSNENFRDLSARLNSALTGEKGLSALDKVCRQNGNMLVILSAYGAAYTVKMENAETATQNLFTVEGKNSADSANYKLISFWVKTSEMTGNTAATLKITDAGEGKDDNSASFTIDTTNRQVDIGENKDIYGGWSQCFFFVKNETDEAKSFTLEFGFGNRAITDAALTSYVPGWIAIADVQTLDVKENVFKLVNEGDYAKTLTFGEEDENDENKFDEANGMSDVKAGVAKPSSYNGVNGGSSYVADKEFGDDYDRQNNLKGAIAGLVNRDGFDKYGEDIKLGIAKAFGYTEAANAWNEVFGKDCYQPLIIVNSLRSYHDRAKANENNFKEYYVLRDSEYVAVSSLPEAEQVFDEDETYYSAETLVKNFGFIGSSQTVSAESYKTVSVRVKVSEGAVAYVYLADPATREVLKYQTPGYTFFYDAEGNVLDKEYDGDWTEAEHREAIVYKLRDDGLYEDGDGKIFANLYNLTASFKYAKFENNAFYEKIGGEYKSVSYDDLKDGTLYYNKNGEEYKLASHYLTADGKRVYEYDSSENKYYYLVNGERNLEVENFSAEYARYQGRENPPEYAVEITDTKGKWVTVNFMIKTGSEAFDYRLELWSGKRDETGVTNGKDTPATGAVAFDASVYGSSLSESDYTTVLGQYENAITDVYTDIIMKKDASKLTSDVTSIPDYEKVLDELGVDEQARKEALGDLYGFDATYYTFTFYDSAKYVPFNKDTAEEGQTGYDYSIEDCYETLAYFRTFDPDTSSYNIFADYSAIDRSVSLNTVNEDDNGSNDAGNTPATGNDGSGWLLITSIIFAAVMLFALVAVLVRYLWKKYGARRRQKKLGRNNYKNRDRAIKKLNVEQAPAPEKTPEETPAEETPAEEPAEETPVEEIPAEETPAETPAEAPAEETPVEETPAETPVEETHTEEDKKDE